MPWYTVTVTGDLEAALDALRGSTIAFSVEETFGSPDSGVRSRELTSVSAIVQADAASDAEAHVLDLLPGDDFDCEGLKQRGF